jgi:glycosyltransferase involved in cell wall biosynthesis
MRIIAYANKNSGVSYHRLIVPLLLMENTDVFITNDLRTEHFEKGCSVFLYNRTLPADAMATVRDLQKQYGFKIVVDIDDWWHLDPHHILYEEYQRVDYAKQQIEHIKNADAVFCTHERLEREIHQHNTNVHILPNAIPHQGQYDIEREPYYLTRLFWQGSDTHKADIEILASAVHKLAPISPKIKMVMSGYVPDHEQWDHMARTYTAGLKHQYKLIPFAPVTSYYAAYAHADICLIPLVNSPFNACKSPLKVLEAANLGLPCIVSQVNPYLNMPVLYARHPTCWVKHIKKLVGSRKAQKEAGAELKEWCDVHYNFHKINKHRKQVLEYISKQNLKATI